MSKSSFVASVYAPDWSLKKRNRDRCINPAVEQSLARTGGLNSNGAWEGLPQEVLINIFSRLSEMDRCHASVACRAWRRVYSLPTLWHTKCFDFRDVNSMKTSTQYMQFLQQFGRHIKNVKIVYKDNTFRSYARLQTLVTEMNKCQALKIKSITVCSPKRHWYSAYFPYKKSPMLSSLLKKQTEIRSADLSNCQFNVVDGIHVLEALTSGIKQRSKSKISYLCLEGFFCLGTQEYPFEYGEYLAVMRRFTALSHISIDQVYMNETLLDELTKNTASTLRTMTLVCIASTEDVEFVITESVWSAVVKRCPMLKVTVQITGRWSRQWYDKIIVDSIPLRELTLERKKGYNAEFVDITYYMNHISSVFYKSIEKMHVIAKSKLSVFADNALVHLVEKCSLLKDVDLDVIVMPETVHRVMSIVSTPLRGRFRMRISVSDLLRKPEDDLWKERFGSEHLSNVKAIVPCQVINFRCY